MAEALEPLLPEPLSLMTVDEYWKLSYRDDAIEELHWGQLVVLSLPKQIYKTIQRRLLALLEERAAAKGWIVDFELAFRALPEYEVTGADVALVPKERHLAIRPNDYLRGSPKWVIEIRSRLNTRAEMREKAALCLGTGTLAFWIVDPGRGTITLLRSGEMPASYTRDDRIPLNLLSDDLLTDDIFS